MIYFCIYFETQLKYLASAFVGSFWRRVIGKHAQETHGEKQGLSLSLHCYCRIPPLPVGLGSSRLPKETRRRISFCLPQTLPFKPCSLLYQRPRGPLLQWISQAPIIMQNDLHLSLLLSTVLTRNAGRSLSTLFHFRLGPNSFRIPCSEPDDLR